MKSNLQRNVLYKTYEKSAIALVRYLFISFGKLLMQISSSMLLLIKLSRNIMLVSSYVVRKTAAYIPIYPSFLAACMTMLKAVKQFHIKGFLALYTNLFILFHS